MSPPKASLAATLPARSPYKCSWSASDFTAKDRGRQPLDLLLPRPPHGVRLEAWLMTHSPVCQRCPQTTTCSGSTWRQAGASTLAPCWRLTPIFVPERTQISGGS